MLMSLSCQEGTSCQGSLNKGMLWLSLLFHQKMNTVKCTLRLYAVTSIHSRFDQKGFKIFSTVEQLLFKACVGQCFKEELDVVCNFFYNDFTREDLEAKLSTLHKLYRSVSGEEMPSVDSIKTPLLSLSTYQQTLLSSVGHLFQLLMILPATNATSEKSFSTLRHIKSYMKSTGTMTQARLNHLMILHYYQDMTDSLVCSQVYFQ